jgi:hypothetical protein
MAEHAHGAVVHRTADDQYLETPPGSGYEHTDAHVRPMVQFAIWLTASAIVVHLALAGMYWVLIRRTAEPPAAARYPLAVNVPPRLPANPRLQQFPRNEMYDFRVKEETQLGSYGWVDKNSGVVHIPIQDAMRLMLERNALASRPADASLRSAQVDEFPSDSSSGRTLERRRE